MIYSIYNLYNHKPFFRSLSLEGTLLKKSKAYNRAPDKVHIFISIIAISSLKPMIDHLLESSHRDDSNKWSNIGFGEESPLKLIL